MHLHMPTYAWNVLKGYITELQLVLHGIKNYIKTFFFFFFSPFWVGDRSEQTGRGLLLCFRSRIYKLACKSKQKAQLFLSKPHFSSRKDNILQGSPCLLTPVHSPYTSVTKQSSKQHQEQVCSGLPLQVFSKFKHCPGHFCSCVYPKISKAFFFLPASHLTLHHPILITFDQQEADTMDWK